MGCCLSSHADCGGSSGGAEELSDFSSIPPAHRLPLWSTFIPIAMPPPTSDVAMPIYRAPLPTSRPAPTSETTTTSDAPGAISTTPLASSGSAHTAPTAPTSNAAAPISIVTLASSGPAHVAQAPIILMGPVSASKAQLSSSRLRRILPEIDSSTDSTSVIRRLFSSFRAPRPVLTCRNSAPSYHLLWVATMAKWSRTLYASSLSGTHRPYDSNTKLTFELFPKLLLYVRMEIWKLLLPGKRLITIQECDRKYTKAQCDDPTLKLTDFCAIGGFIRLLAINKEARSFAIQQYGVAGAGFGGLVDANCYVNQEIGDFVMFEDINTISDFARIYIFTSGSLINIKPYTFPARFSSIDLRTIHVGWSPEPTTNTITPALPSKPGRKPWNPVTQPYDYYPGVPTNLVRLLEIVVQLGGVTSICLVHKSKELMVLRQSDIPATDGNPTPATIINETYMPLFIRGREEHVEWVESFDSLPDYKWMRMSAWSVPEFRDALREDLEKDL
ncbi:hypothetical protein IFR05_014444 [Cadophora sp. M221]|nr:hypothetical protein IFR05_014444 [Cadophora sp. M221]